MGHVGQELGLVPAGQGQFLGLDLQVAACRLHLLLLAAEHLVFLFQLLVGDLQLLLLGPQLFLGTLEPLGLFLQLLVGGAQLLLLGLELLGHGLGLFQGLGQLAPGFRAVQSNGDAFGHGVQELLLELAALVQGAQLQHGRDYFIVHDGLEMDATRRGPAQPEATFI